MLTEFSYRDPRTGWSLNPLQFSSLCLLVGGSGVGKTRILRSILSAQRTAQGRKGRLFGVEWNLAFTTLDGKNIHWELAFEPRHVGASGLSFATEDDFVDDDDDSEDSNRDSDKANIAREVLKIDDEEVINRSSEQFLFNGTQTPKLSQTESAIHLLRHEDVVTEVRDALAKIHFRDCSHHPTYQFPFFAGHEKFAAKLTSLELLQKSDIPPTIKLAILEKNIPEVFEKIRSRYCEIFPHVEDVQHRPLRDLDLPKHLMGHPVLHIKEQGVTDYIPEHRMSAGMLRTLMHLADLFLLPAGSVVLIDEFENSLGANCINVVTDDLVNSQHQLQFILSSHHPYVIEQVSTNYWKVVTRKGGIVTATDAGVLGIGKSKHSYFKQLLNLPAFTDGIDTQ